MSVPQPPRADEVPTHLEFRVGRLTLDPHRVIYGTIMLMTAYALIDEGTDPLGGGAYAELVAITFAPLFALAMAHAFSDALDIQIRNSRRLNRHDRRHIAATNVQYHNVALPPILVMGLLTLLTWDANDIVALLMLLGAASLVFWGSFAARKAGLGRLRQLTFGITYGLMGVLVIVVELIITH